MKINEIILPPSIVDKLTWKHDVSPYEVHEVFKGKPYYRKIQKGHQPNEHLYAALGQTNSGRYLIVFFVYKTTQDALVISAREMTDTERKLYGKV